MQTAAQLAAFQQHYDDMAEPDLEVFEMLADAAGMEIEGFLAECAKRNEEAEREAAFAPDWRD